MFEVCTKRRLFFVIGLFLSVSLITLIVETSWPAHHKHKVKGKDKDNDTLCKTGHTIIVNECERCSKDELRAEKSVCQDTGFKEFVLCDGSGEKYFRSCEITPYLDERNFWIFQAVMFFIGVASYTVVYIRQRKLHSVLMEKIHRQIGAGI